MKIYLTPMVSSIAALGLTGCLAELQQTPTRVVAAPSETVQQIQAIPYTGPKKRVAVMRFENKAGYQGQGEIGIGMAEQLVTSLVKTSRFIVLERQALQDIVGEQQFGASGMVKQETALKTGEIEAPQFLIYGAVTSFKSDQAGGGVGTSVGQGASLGSTLGGALAPLGGGAAIGALLGGLFAAGANYQQAYVSIDLRIVDAKTGRVVNATSVEGTPQSAGASAGAAPGEVAFGVSGFYNTPMGQAVRACIDKAVDWVIKNAFAETTAGVGGPSPLQPSSFAPAPSVQSSFAPSGPPLGISPGSQTPASQVVVYTLADRYNLRETPNGKPVATLNQGTEVFLLETSGEWSKVELQDGRTGWITSRGLKKGDVSKP